MIMIPMHRMDFECVNNPGLELPSVLWPAHIYKEGEEILRLYFEDGELTPKPLSTRLRVTGVKHELHQIVDAKQVMVVYVEEVKEDG